MDLTLYSQPMSLYWGVIPGEWMVGQLRLFFVCTQPIQYFFGDTLFGETTIYRYK